MNIQDKLIEIIADVIDVEEDALSGEIGPEEIDEWDSVNSLRILTNIETELGVRLPLDEYNRSKSIGELAEIIRRYYE
ncbi:acyl carrier protein [Evansella sp. AB-rgal1]|uniref:acyl carrier protein n=1 Tax=Evansella sp. AB-rgal1 TaxID=3242696 RepID=UPI00359E3A05